MTLSIICLAGDYRACAGIPAGNGLFAKLVIQFQKITVFTTLPCLLVTGCLVPK